MAEILEEYRRIFNDQFPLMLVRGMGDADIIKIIEGCLKSGKPYEPDLEEGCLY